MAKSTNEIAAAIIATLRTTDPELDTSTGAVSRKIIDAVAEQIAEASIDKHMLTYQYDINSKVGADLDDFCALFGIGRQAAKRASGVVTLIRGAATTEESEALIPAGSEVTDEYGDVVFQTIYSAFFDLGSYSTSVPVVAVIAGTSGNLPANSLVNLDITDGEVESVSNDQPTTGGVDQESDDALRARWKSTVFRNLAGTDQMYTGIALDHENCYLANVVSASKRRREQVQISSGAAVTSVADAAYVYADPVFVGYNIDAGDIAIKDAAYTWNTSVNPPRIDVLDATALVNNDLVEVDFEYVPKCSRNDPANGITNRVDVFVGGTKALNASQSLLFKTNSPFSSTSTNPFYTAKFNRPDGTTPTAGNYFVPLAWSPILTVPSTIVIDGVTYGEVSQAHPMGTQASVVIDGVTTTVKYAYQIVHDVTSNGRTATSLAGLEWLSTMAPANNRAFTIGDNSDYTYNAMIGEIQEAINRWRLGGVDARVHEAAIVPLRVNIAVMYDPGVSQPVVNQSIDAALGEFFVQVGFQNAVQASDILQAIHNVAGVDNVRFLHGGDYSGYVANNPNAYNVGIQRMTRNGVAQSYVDLTGRPQDLRLADNQITAFHSCFKVARAANTFGGL